MLSKEAVRVHNTFTAPQLIGRANIVLNGNPIHLSTLEIKELSKELKAVGEAKLARKLVP